MKEEKQLVLFFSKGTRIDSANLAAKLKNKFEQLGEPAVIPFNPNNPNQPLIVFDQGKINLTIGISDVSLIYQSENHSKYYDTIIGIIECFEDIDAVRSFRSGRHTEQEFWSEIVD